MKYLLDTHVLIWALTNDARLPAKIRDIILSPDNLISVSTASLWEIAIKNQKNPEKCPYHERTINNYCREAGFSVMNITPEHIMSIRTLQTAPDKYLSNLDPFDRLLTAQAKAEGFIILTHDSNFRNYDETCILIF